MSSAALPPPPMPSLPMPSLPGLVLRLCRAKMTVISAVTHLAAALVATLPPDTPPFSVSAYLRSWLFILLAQFMTHFFGELHDLASDRLNRHATPLTGGSRVLAHGLALPALARRLALAAAAAAAATLALLVPAPARPLGLAMLLLALAYTTPPVKLNYRALGELDAALITSVLVPLYAARAQGVVSAHHLMSRPMLLLIVPPFFAKVALFLALNQADRRADWVTGKHTLACRLGDVGTARAHAALLAAAYASAVGLALAPAPGLWRDPGLRDAAVLLFLLPGARVGLRLSLAMLRAMPYRLDALLPAVLTHSTFMVWGIALHAALFATPSLPPLSPQNAFLCAFAWLTVRNMRRPRRERGIKAALDDSSDDGATAAHPVLPITTPNPSSNADGSAQQQEPQPAARDAQLPPTGPQQRLDTALNMSEDTVTTADERVDVVVVGAGVAGLVTALSLRALGRTVLVLERRPRSAASDGADLALWPGAIAILRRLGVPSEFFERETLPLHTVKMCNMRFETDGPVADELTAIDMDAVTAGTGEHFVLVARDALMAALWALVPPDLVACGARVVAVAEDEDADCVTLTYETDADTDVAHGPTTHTVTARVAVGADGSRSRLREHVNPTLGAASAVRFCGEVCYRGVLSLHTLRADDRRVEKLLPDAPEDGTMRINYGAGLRSSFGFVRADGGAAYWWVKRVVTEMPASRGKLARCDWPEPLRSLHDLTPDDAFYVHAIEDAASLPRWASPRVVLAGDAAHVVTPNMGQGACLAAEDGFVLAAELAKHWNWPDGHVEAFYRYQMCRKPFAEAVAGEARKQLIIGQLSSPLAVWLRDKLLSWLPVSILVSKLRQNNFNVKPYIDLFDELTAERGL